jgi:ABC-type antimicrobial peptide transport system permease subunit
MLLVLGGLAIALMLLPGVDGWVQQLVSGLPRTGFLLMTAVAVAVTAVAMLMVMGPARRAGRIPPAEALRTD